MSTRSVRNTLHRATTVLFLGALALPLTIHLVTVDDPRDVWQENRTPAPRPQWSADPASWSSLPKALEDYYRDFVRGRTSLLRTQRLLRWALFGETPVGSQTIRGKDDWIFFTGNDALAQHRGEQPWSAAMLAQACDVLERRRDQLAALGVRYLFVVAPDKMSIFPEQLPTWALPLAERTPLDQLLEAATARGLSDVLLDLRPALRAQKGARPIYYARGTHWTPLGAYHGYAEIAKRLLGQSWPPTKSGEAILALPADAFAFEDCTVDSWGERWHLSHELRHPGASIDWPELREHRLARSWWPQVAGKRTHPDHLYHAPRRPGSCLLVFHDSFWAGLVPYFANHFSATAACSTYGYDPLLAEALGAQIVLQVCVERNLEMPFREDLERLSSRAWLGEEELATTYASPRWDEMKVEIAEPGQLTIEGARCGAFRVTRSATGIYLGTSPLLGPLRLAFLREDGARHLIVRPSAIERAFSFVAEGADAARDETISSWAGRYGNGALAYDLLARGRALWVFDEQGELTQVLAGSGLGAEGGATADVRQAELRWSFARDGERGPRVRLEVDSAPGQGVELRRIAPLR